MRTLKRNNILKNERGMALLETVPLLVIFAMLISFALGLFGYIHSGILHSISARTYAFETFRNRTNLNFFRENGTGLTMPLYYAKKGIRYHAITSRKGPENQFVATGYPIKLGQMGERKGNDAAHTQRIFELQARNQSVEVNPTWLMIGYGICTNYTCGDGR